MKKKFLVLGGVFLLLIIIGSFLFQGGVINFSSETKKPISSEKKKEEEFNVKNDGMYKFAREYLMKEPIDYFIFGHRHQMVNIPINKKTNFVLLGDWITNFSFGVFDGEKFELKRFNDRVVN